jgi:hypothetical protein
MISSFSNSSFQYLASHRFALSSGILGGLLLGLLIVLLVEKEVLRAVVRSLPATTRRAFDMAALPLLLAFAIVVIERFRTLGF